METRTRPCPGRGRACHRKRPASWQGSVEEAEPGHREGRSGCGETRHAPERARRSDLKMSAMRVGGEASPCRRGDTVSLTTGPVVGERGDETASS